MDDADRTGVARLAFENFHEQPPPELWRVFALRPCGDETIRHVNWFATEEAARNHAEWISDGRGTVLSVARYTLKD